MKFICAKCGREIPPGVPMKLPEGAASDALASESMEHEQCPEVDLERLLEDEERHERRRTDLIEADADRDYAEEAYWRTGGEE